MCVFLPSINSLNFSLNSPLMKNTKKFLFFYTWTKLSSRFRFLITKQKYSSHIFFNSKNTQEISIKKNFIQVLRVDEKKRVKISLQLFLSNTNFYATSQIHNSQRKIFSILTQWVIEYRLIIVLESVRHDWLLHPISFQLSRKNLDSRLSIWVIAFTLLF